MTGPAIAPCALPYVAQERTRTCSFFTFALMLQFISYMYTSNPYKKFSDMYNFIYAHARSLSTCC